MAALTPITQYSLHELEVQLDSMGVERYRAKQIAQWVYRRRADTFEKMTDLSKELRTLLAERFTVLGTTVAKNHESPDGTVKLLVRLADGNLIETVLIREGERKTVCVSTQVGCPVKCVFCASGLDGLVRNLEAHEIIEQVIHVQKLLPAEERVDNLVIMGIGEPLLNADNLVKALRAWKTTWGMGIGYNRITLSTVGIVDKLQKLVDEGTTPNLALSLHAPNDRIRLEVVPTMKKWSVTDIIKAGMQYKEATNKEVTFEYVLLAGVNDDKKHALELGKKVRGSRCKVNVIPFNRVEEVPYKEPSEESIDRFVTALGGCGVPVMVRKRKGDAISAACGQLRAVTEKSAKVAVAGAAVKIPPEAREESGGEEE